MVKQLRSKELPWQELVLLFVVSIKRCCLCSHVPWWLEVTSMRVCVPLLASVATVVFLLQGCAEPDPTGSPAPLTPAERVKSAPGNAAVVLAAAKEELASHRIASLEYASEKLRGDSALMLSVLAACVKPETCEATLDFAPDNLRGDKWFMLQAVAQKPAVHGFLTRANASLQNDEDFVLGALHMMWSHQPQAVDWQLGRLLGPLGTIEPSTIDDWVAGGGAGETVLNSPRYTLSVLGHYVGLCDRGKSPCRLARRFHNIGSSKDFVVAMLMDILKKMPPSLQGDESFMTSAVGICPFALKYASDEIKASPLVVLRALVPPSVEVEWYLDWVPRREFGPGSWSWGQTHGEMFRYAPVKLRQDRSFFLTFLRAMANRAAPQAKDTEKSAFSYCRSSGSTAVEDSRKTRRSTLRSAVFMTLVDVSVKNYGIKLPEDMWTGLAEDRQGDRRESREFIRNAVGSYICLCDDIGLWPGRPLQNWLAISTRGRKDFDEAWKPVTKDFDEACRGFYITGRNKTNTNASVVGSFAQVAIPEQDGVPEDVLPYAREQRLSSGKDDEPPPYGSEVPQSSDSEVIIEDEPYYYWPQVYDSTGQYGLVEGLSEPDANASTALLEGGRNGPPDGSAAYPGSLLVTHIKTQQAKANEKEWQDIADAGVKGLTSVLEAGEDPSAKNVCGAVVAGIQLAAQFAPPFYNIGLSVFGGILSSFTPVFAKPKSKSDERGVTNAEILTAVHSGFTSVKCRLDELEKTATAIKKSLFVTSVNKFEDKLKDIHAEYITHVKLLNQCLKYSEENKHDFAEAKLKDVLNQLKQFEDRYQKDVNGIFMPTVVTDNLDLVSSKSDVFRATMMYHNYLAARYEHFALRMHRKLFDVDKYKLPGFLAPELQEVADEFKSQIEAYEGIARGIGILDVAGFQDVVLSKCSFERERMMEVADAFNKHLELEDDAPEPPDKDRKHKDTKHHMKAPDAKTFVQAMRYLLRFCGPPASAMVTTALRKFAKYPAIFQIAYWFRHQADQTLQETWRRWIAVGGADVLDVPEFQYALDLLGQCTWVIETVGVSWIDTKGTNTPGPAAVF